MFYLLDEQTKFVKPTLTFSRNERCITQLRLNTPVLTAECPSRLGNQMFSYAIIFAVSNYNQREAYMSPTMSSFLSKYFQVSVYTLDLDLYSSTPWTIQYIGAHVPANIKNLPTQANGTASRIKFCCYPQTWKYFDEIRPLILEEFQFHPKYVQRAQFQLSRAHETFYASKAESKVTFIGVHVRRGDYVQQQKMYGFDFPTVDFYRSAMLYFSRKVSNPIFVLASDDISWCQSDFRPLERQYSIYYISGTSQENGGADLAVLSSCDHVIFGLGTFGFWAGYLNPGEVVYCSDCVKNDSAWMEDPMVFGGSYSNFALPTWTGITCNGFMS